MSAACCLGIGLGAQQQPTSTQDGVFTEEQADSGADLYQQTCVKCHGPSLAGSDMVPALAGQKFTAGWNGASVGELYDRIRLSMPADMPATLERGQALAAVAFILRANGAPSGMAALPSDEARLKNLKIAGLK